MTMRSCLSALRMALGVATLSTRKTRDENMTLVDNITRFGGDGHISAGARDIRVRTNPQRKWSDLCPQR